MVFTRKKGLQNKKLPNQLSGSDTDVMIEKNNQESQIDNRTNTVDETITLNYTNGTTQVSDCQVDMYTLEGVILTTCVGK